MGCQKEIAAKIVAGGGDYVLALKGNHEHLHAGGGGGVHGGGRGRLSGPRRCDGT